MKFKQRVNKEFKDFLSIFCLMGDHDGGKHIFDQNAN
jgi:hypothetical protein